MKIKNLLLTLWLCAFAFSAVAQTDTSKVSMGQELSLTLDSAVTYALEHSKKMQSASMEVQKAEYDKKMALSNMLLNVSASLDVQHMLGYELNLMGQKIPMPTTGNLGITASLAFNGQMFMAYKLQDLAIQMQQLSSKSTEFDLRSSVTTSYLSVLIAKESGKILLETRNNIQSTYNSMKQMVSVGMLEQTDADQLKVTLMTLDNQIRMVERNTQLAENALKVLIGAKPGDKLNLTQELDYFFETLDAASTLDQSFNVNNNVNVQLLDKNVELAQKTLILDRWAFGPTLSLAYQYSGKTYFGKQAGFNMSPPHVLVVSLNVPIFSSGKRYYQCQKDKVSIDIANTQREETIDMLTIQDSQLRFTLSNAIDNYLTSKESLDLNKKILKNSLQKYRQGTISSTDLVSVNNNLLSAQSTYIQSLYDVISAQAELLKLYSSL